MGQCQLHSQHFPGHPSLLCADCSSSHFTPPPTPPTRRPPELIYRCDHEPFPHCADRGQRVTPARAAWLLQELAQPTSTTHRSSKPTCAMCQRGRQTGVPHLALHGLEVKAARLTGSPQTLGRWLAHECGNTWNHLNKATCAQTQEPGEESTQGHRPLPSPTGLSAGGMDLDLPPRADLGQHRWRRAARD